MQLQMYETQNLMASLEHDLPKFLVYIVVICILCCYDMNLLDILQNLMADFLF